MSDERDDEATVYRRVRARGGGALAGEREDAHRGGARAGHSACRFLRRWQVRIGAAGAGPLSPPAPAPRSASLPMPADQASEIARLRRDLDRMRIERDILRKAVGIFA